MPKHHSEFITDLIGGHASGVTWEPLWSGNGEHTISVDVTYLVDGMEWGNNTIPPSLARVPRHVTLMFSVSADGTSFRNMNSIGNDLWQKPIKFTEVCDVRYGGLDLEYVEKNILQPWFDMISLVVRIDAL